MVKKYLYFPTQRKNLLSILGHGAIFAADCEYRHVEDARDDAGGSIPLFEPPVPREALHGPISDVVLVKLSRDLIPLLKKMDSVYKVDNGYQSHAPIPLMKAESFLFPDRSELEEFTLRMFDDIPVDESLLGVWSDEELPASGTGFIFGSAERPEGRNREEKGDAETQPEAGRWCLVDRALGGLSVCASVCDIGGQTPYFLENILRISLKASAGDEVDSSELAALYGDRPEEQSLEADAWILNRMLKILSTSSPEEGLVPEEVIEDMIEKSESESESLRSDIRKWCSFVRGVLGGEKEVRNLGDDGKLAHRAALLFLLRPEVTRAASAKSASFSPGERVQSLGCFLAGFWAGLVRLGPEFKFGYSDHVRFVHHFTVLSAKVQKSGKIPSVRAEVEGDPGALSRQIVLKHGRSVIFSKNMEIDPRLRTLFHFAESAHYRMEFDFEGGCLSHRITLPNGRGQVVRVSCIGEGTKDDVKIVRFTSTCREFKKALSKDDANDLLTRNNGLDMHCRFAIDPRRSEVVIQVDHRFQHMPTDAFHSHMEHVAEIADRYEQEVSGDEDTY